MKDIEKLILEQIEKIEFEIRQLEQSKGKCIYNPFNDTITQKQIAVSNLYIALSNLKRK